MNGKKIVMKDLPYVSLNLKFENCFNPEKWKPEMRALATLLVHNNIAYYFGGISG